MEDLERQKNETMANLENLGYLKNPEVKKAMLKVRRELFVLSEYRKEAWIDTPLPVVGKATISAPHMYAIMLEAADLKKGEKVLEIGTGSGYGSALIKEIVKGGEVVTMEIFTEVCNFAKKNLKKAGYGTVKVICGDGSQGYDKEAPYDAIIVTAACPEIPKPLIEQLKPGGRLLAPVGGITTGQDLIYLFKTKGGEIKKKVILPVIFLPLFGKFGYKV